MGDSGVADDRPDTFEARLAKFVLYAFARGVGVEGTRHLTGAASPIPDLTVTVMRVDRDPTVDPSSTPDDPEFPARLQRFLLEEFAEGTEIVGSWSIRFPRPGLPAWDVEIEMSGMDTDRTTVERQDT